MAERVGFEPTVAFFRRHAISSRAYSATLAPLREGLGKKRESHACHYTLRDSIMCRGREIETRFLTLAERVGFEPTMELPPYWFSRPAP